MAHEAHDSDYLRPSHQDGAALASALASALVRTRYARAAVQLSQLGRPGIEI